MSGFLQRTCAVVANEALAQDTYRLRLDVPDLAAAIRPGQFVMLRLAGRNDPLLGRPFALYDTHLDGRARPVQIDIVYLVVGKMTGAMTLLRPGDKVEAWGPLGNGFPNLGPLGHVGLVAGGIGQTPFLAYIRQLLGQRGFGTELTKRTAERVTLYYGVRTRALLCGIDDFREAGAQIHIATDDGSHGFHGFVTDLLASHEPPDHFVGCGPEPMMAALARQAADWHIPCHLSLETPMACGIGICFSCVARVKTPTGWDYRRTCVDGPVFDARELA